MRASYIFNFMSRFGIGIAAVWWLSACGFHLSIKNNSNSVLPSLTITPSIELTSTIQSVDESAGVVTITIEKSYANDTATVVPFTISGSATSGIDHDLTNGSITIAAGATAGTTTFTITNDLDPELEETIILTLGTLDAEALAKWP